MTDAVEAAAPVRAFDIPRIIREPEVLSLMGICHTTLRRMEKDGEFPKRRRFSKRLVGWSEREVRNWVVERLEGEEV